MVVTWCLACIKIDKACLNTMAGLLVFASLCEMLTLIALASDMCNDFDCQARFGVGVSVVASVFLFIEAILFCRIPAPTYAPRAPASQPQQQQALATPQEQPAGTTKTARTSLSDGTKKTVKTIYKTIYNTDGSKTVEETIVSTPSASATGASVVNGMYQTAEARLESPVVTSVDMDI